MLPMITVAGSRNTRRYNARWHNAAAPSQWWQNPTLSFGTGYPQYVPSSSIELATPPIRANQTRVLTRPRVRSADCYRTPGGCKGGYAHAGYDVHGQSICCPGRTGPAVRNPPPRATSGRGRAVSPGGTRHEACRAVCQHHGVGIEFHKCYQECMGVFRSKPETTRASARMAASARRRSASVGHAGRSGNACCGSCANGGACEGGCGANCTCGKEGPMANMARQAPRTRMRHRPSLMETIANAAASILKPSRPRAPGCWVKGKYVVPCPKTGTISASTHTRAPGCWVKGKYVVPCPKTGTIGVHAGTRAPKCQSHTDCGSGRICVNGRCVQSAAIR